MSNQLIICTTGTSIARGVQRLDEVGVKKYNQLIKNRVDVEQKKSKKSDDFIRTISAEMNSLNSFGLDKSDKVVLLHTETEDGLICAENIALLIKKCFNLDSALVKVNGMQVNDALRFRKEGIQNLFKELDRLIYGYSPENIVLNGTGGFKGVVPYLTLYGLLNRISTLYLFEFSNELIKLPPVPISYDYDRLNKAYKALEKIDIESFIPEETFFKLIPDLKYEDRPWFESLIEDIGDGEVTMSPFALIMWESMRKNEGQIYLSKQALKSYTNSSGQVREQFNFMLSRITNPLWRNDKIHPCKGSDMEFYKPGNTSERIAAITKGNDVYICELMQHAEYEKKISTCQKKNYNTKEFELFIFNENESIPDSEEFIVQKLNKEKDAVFKELLKCKKLYAKQETNLMDMEIVIEEGNNEILALKEKSENENKRNSEQIAYLKSKNINDMSLIQIIKKKLFIKKN